MCSSPDRNNMCRLGRIICPCLSPLTTGCNADRTSGALTAVLNHGYHVLQVAGPWMALSWIPDVEPLNYRCVQNPIATNK